MSLVKVQKQSITCKFKKRVRFADTSTLIVTVGKTTNQNKASWYNRDDIRRFKKDVKDSSSLLSETQDSKAMKLLGYSVQEGISQPKVKVEDVTSIRGLEHLLSRDVCKVLVRARTHSIARVLDEQARQRHTGEYDAAKLAVASLKSSRFAVDWRQLIADV